MQWTLDKSRPICPQICEQICLAVANGEFAAGEKLFSVREVALMLGVNPNTVQKSFEELERRLRSRGDTDEAQISVRLARAQWEMDQSPKYDYIVINDQVEACADEILKIISE